VICAHRNIAGGESGGEVSRNRKIIIMMNITSEQFLWWYPEGGGKNRTGGGKRDLKAVRKKTSSEKRGLGKGCTGALRGNARKRASNPYSRRIGIY